MVVDPANMRIEGVYQQRQPGYFMVRVKVPAGILSAEQALKVCEIAERHGKGSVHLTSRASVEFHWLQEESLAEVMRMLAAVGLTSRGACGGAVRTVVCSTPFLQGFPTVQVLATKLHQHFTGNPHFEGLPKKFKIGVDAGYAGGRHLIQDIGLVYAGDAGGGPSYDVWAAGGLGREPQAGFLLQEGVAEARLIPLIEAVIRLYRELTPAGKRLKHLVRDIGQEGFRRLLQERLDPELVLSLSDGCDKCLTERPGALPVAYLEARVFAGELSVATMRELATVAASFAGGFLVLTPEQNIAFFLQDGTAAERAAAALARAGFGGESPQERVPFRVCPGNHECRMGLVATRDLAQELIAGICGNGEKHGWAIAGCPNSCSQPQLADVGIVAVKMSRGAGDDHLPMFDLYRRQDGEAFGKVVRQGIGLDELRKFAAQLG
jgi:sulfite reductase (ferredoxin)